MNEVRSGDVIAIAGSLAGRSVNKKKNCKKFIMISSMHKVNRPASTIKSVIPHPNRLQVGACKEAGIVECKAPYDSLIR